MKTAPPTTIEINRMTKQKRLVLDILRSTTTHPTADWIHLRAIEEIGNISRSTVYRNLNILVE
ncbi:MAG: transcriptional repressor, partial [Caldisericia bacterium]|nr:transcriptional repressor [Caldisericia bacterium]